MNNGINQTMISVIIPVYNTAQYLQRCISSITENTYKNLEVICINDGSTDNSLDILNEIAQKDERIKIINKVNGGVSTARNRGLQEAKGDYVCFIDSDDWVHREFFEILLSASKGGNMDVIIGGCRECVSLEKEVGYDKKEIKERIIALSVDEVMSHGGNIRNYVTGRLYKKRVLKNLFPENIQLGEDTIFNLLVLSDNELKIINIDWLYFYFVGCDTSLTHIKSYDAYFSMGEWILEHINLFVRKDFAIHVALTAFLN